MTDKNRSARIGGDVNWIHRFDDEMRSALAIAESYGNAREAIRKLKELSERFTEQRRAIDELLDQAKTI